MRADPAPPPLDFEAAGIAAEDGEALVIDLDGYEGPLHVLLALARTQKVDLLKLSILKLADQYLAFVHQARRLRFSLAADYLVMAAWLTYLKSRLLLPKPDKTPQEEPPAEAVAAALAWRLAKLDLVRKAAKALMERPQLGLDVFARGDPQAIRVVPSIAVEEGDLYGLMRAYAEQRKSHVARHYRPRAPEAYSLEDARARLRAMLPQLDRWKPLAGVAPSPAGPGQQPTRASFLASTLSASLELVKEGSLEARQLEPFTDLYLRRRRLEAAE
jgi:segregation and condensation protein A